MKPETSEVHVVRLFNLLDPPWVWKDLELAFTTREDAIQYGAKIISEQEHGHQWTYTIVPFTLLKDFFDTYELDIDLDLEG